MNHFPHRFGDHRVHKYTCTVGGPLECGGVTTEFDRTQVGFRTNTDYNPVDCGIALYRVEESLLPQPRTQ